MNFLRCGDRAILIELPSLNDVLALTDAVEEANIPGVEDLVPAARTLLVQVAAGIGVHDVRRQLSTIAPQAHSREPVGTVQVPVRYDGPDLEEVAAICSLSEREVIEIHTGQLWTSAFVGFAPGFSYLVPSEVGLVVPRRATPRVSVETGSVGFAGEFSGIYPRRSPGGWHIVGHTQCVLWDVRRESPSLLPPGCGVRFVEVQ